MLYSSRFRTSRLLILTCRTYRTCIRLFRAEDCGTSAHTVFRFCCNLRMYIRRFHSFLRSDPRFSQQDTSSFRIRLKICSRHTLFRQAGIPIQLHFALYSASSPFPVSSGCNPLPLYPRRCLPYNHILHIRCYTYDAV